MSESATVTIERIAAGGDGIARHDGMVVFVPRAVPGDVVSVDVNPLIVVDGVPVAVDALVEVAR